MQAPSQPVYYLIMPPQKQLKTVDYLQVAKFSGGFAALFILMQILGMMFEIFNLQ